MFAGVQDDPLSRAACSEGTRNRILSIIEEWTERLESDMAAFCWMKGSAGTGKTSIAYSLCKDLHQRRLLGASYFCYHLNKESTFASRIITTLSYQLAYASPSFAVRLLDSLQTENDMGNDNTESIFKRLILYPAQGLEIATRLIVVCDGFDEFPAGHNREVANQVLTLFAKYSRTLPFKLIISCRPEIDIVEVLKPTFDVISQIDLNVGSFREGIVKLIHDRFTEAQVICSDKQLERLADNAGAQFVYAETVSRYICQPSVRPHASIRLKALLEHVPHPQKAYSPLDTLYHHILECACGPANVSRSLLHHALRMITIESEPQSLKIIFQILTTKGLHQPTIATILNSLTPVLLFQAGQAAIYHKSFKDFLLDESRSGGLLCSDCPEIFRHTGHYLDLAQSHAVLAEYCFEYMKTCLVHDNCFNLDMKEQSRVIPGSEKYRVSEALAYACLQFIPHILNSTTAYKSQLERKIALSVPSFKQLVLRWIECMAWLGETSYAFSLLDELGKVSVHHT